MIGESTIKEIFTSTIAGRGREYYEKGYVIKALKMNNTLFAEVAGRSPQPYLVEVDLGSLESSCTCPYFRMCKHGAAALFHLAGGGEVIDCSAVFDDLKKLPKGELVKLLESLVLSNPSVIEEITFLLGGSKDIGHLVDEFGRGVASAHNFAAQQQVIRRLERAVKRSILTLPGGTEKADLLIQFLEDIRDYFGDVDDSNGVLAALVGDGIDALVLELDVFEGEFRSQLIARLKNLEEDEYGYFDYISDSLEEAGR